MSDYYEILGVSREATTEEIKRAYRKLARQHHPDIAGPESEERFKQITEAHEVLSNPEKRQMYDVGGSQGGSGAGFGFSDMFDFFAAAAGGATQRGPVSRSRRGQDALVRVSISLADATFGVTKELEVDTAVMCEACHGTCTRPGTSPTTCPTCHGRGSVQRVARSFFGNIMTNAPCSDCGGFGTIISEPCAECSGEGRVRARRTISVNIPAGVDTGTRIKLTGKAEVGPGGGPAGDLYVEVREQRHETFTRRGDDLHCTVELPVTAAALGTVVTLETLDGIHDVDIAPGSQPGQVLTLKGLGVGHLNRTGRGDLNVHLEVEVPTRLSEEEEELLRQLAVLRGEERPEARVAATKNSVFQRLKDTFASR
ncbi:molecular chaperone DnaJ [Pseudactinotalea sp. HY160]|uniref:molecular chaperone DnaJ n=1 Tax=Pseudactinotalea sp. HY160 TaxID=2654490 RepID=UPI001310EE31|nr:molecular chaperone DnaJ [Pseudactinotalea sp. HY160]